MSGEIKLWQFVLERLQQSKSVILMCVLESKGSSPGRQGFKMAVADDGMFGSVGGGMMEHKFVEMAKEKLQTMSDDAIIRKQIHSKSAKKNQSGMICSGEQTIALLNLTYSDIDLVEKIIRNLGNNKRGSLLITPEEISFSEEGELIPDYYFEMQSEESWIYRERTGYKNHLYIIGGGHCSLAFSELMSKMDFYIHLYEDRKDLNTLVRNNFAHEKTVVADYSELKNIIPSGENIYVVIMTFGYRTDDVALRALIDKDFKYLGVLGSQTKMEQMFVEWRRDGLPEEKLKKIFAPIGFNINSQSPAEIAVSIAAEIISVKNSK